MVRVSGVVSQALCLVALGCMVVASRAQTAGTQVCTEKFKHGLNSFFYLNDFWAIADDYAELCDLCVQNTRLMILLKNEPQHEKDWKGIAADQGCKYTEKFRAHDCKKLNTAIAVAYEKYLTSTASQLTAKEKATTYSLAFATEKKARALCETMVCCRPRKTNATAPSAKPGTVAASNSTSNSTVLKHPDVLAGMSLDEQKARIEADRKAVQEDRDMVTKMKLILDKGRADLAARAGIVLKKEAAVQEAVSTGRIKCNEKQLLEQCKKLLPPPPPPQNNSTAGNSTTPKSQAKNGTTTTTPPPDAKKSGATTEKKPEVTPVKFAEISRLPPNSLSPTLLPPSMTPQQAPPLPPGYKWQYEMVSDDKL